MKWITRREVLVGGVAAGMTALASTPGRTARAETGAVRARAVAGAATQPNRRFAHLLIRNIPRN